MALLKLADKYSVERLEAACTKVLTYTVNYQIKIVEKHIKFSNKIM
jgi:hypothetical protein